MNIFLKMWPQVALIIMEYICGPHQKPPESSTAHIGWRVITGLFHYFTHQNKERHFPTRAISKNGPQLRTPPRCESYNYHSRRGPDSSGISQTPPVVFIAGVAVVARPVAGRGATQTAVVRGGGVEGCRGDFKDGSQHGFRKRN